MIHRALFGSIERFFGILTEHYAGAFPAWLAPVQVVGIPVADNHVDYLAEMVARLRKRGIRAEVDTSDDRMAKKIVNHTNQKVPFMLLAGDRDVEAGAVSFRFGDRTQIGAVHLATSLVADLQLIAAALVWGFASYVAAEGLTREATASVVSLSGGALMANIVSVVLLVVETVSFQRR